MMGEEKKPMCRERGKKISFSKEGINVVFGPKYRLLVLLWGTLFSRRYCINLECIEYQITL